MKIVKGFLMIVGLLTCFIGVEPVQQFLTSTRQLLITFIIKIFQTAIAMFTVVTLISYNFDKILGV